MTASDVDLVVGDLATAAGKWHEIGSAFKLLTAFLEELKSQEKGAEASLYAVIAELLGGANAKPTWEAVRDVLRSEAVGEQTLAEQLDQKYSIGDKNSGKSVE